MVSLATFMDQAVQDQAVQGPRSVLNTSQVAPADDPVDFRVEADSGSFVIIALQCAATLCMVRMVLMPCPFVLSSLLICCIAWPGGTICVDVHSSDRSALHSVWRSLRLGSSGATRCASF